MTNASKYPETDPPPNKANDGSGVELQTESGEPIYYDANDIPLWWSWMFAGTLIIAPFYLLVHHSGNENRTAVGSYEVALAKAMNAQLDALGDVSLDRDSMVRFMDEPSWLQVGKSVFKANCASCHGQKGEGMIGPNLCDDHYKNVSKVEDFLNILANGAAGGAMPAWKGKLSDVEIVLVSAYAANLRNSDPPGAKAAEGREIPAWDL
ncbi:MAG: c-type cytochrome [Planctomycetota bacterium]